jgi:hypothetical protein
LQEKSVTDYQGTGHKRASDQKHATPLKRLRLHRH